MVRSPGERRSTRVPDREGNYSDAISLNASTNSFVDMGSVYPFTSGDFTVVGWIKVGDGGGGDIAGIQDRGYVNGYEILAGSSEAIFYASAGSFARLGLAADV